MNRVARAWRAMDAEQRLAAAAALALLVTMLLPWYGKTDTFVVRGAAKATQASLNAFQAFSFVEAAVLLVGAGVLAMLYERAEGRSFRLPGGDGLVTMLAGGWIALLIFYRLLDKPTLQGNERITSTVGVEWGIFMSLLVALALVYAGSRMRAREQPEPPARRGERPGARDAAAGLLAADAEVRASAARSRPRSAPPVPARPRGDYPPAPAAARERASGREPASEPEQLSFEDPPTRPR